MTDKTEVRFELPTDDIAVFDAYSIATGRSRTAVMAEILAQWIAAKRHEATLICRVAGINPTITDAERRAEVAYRTDRMVA